ncbi:MAG TPA: hypothetical protein VGI39_15955, partial [Polyangiaceae bacterium]
ASEASALWSAVSALESHRLGAPDLRDPWRFARLPRPIFDALDDVRPAARALGGVRAALTRKVAWSAVRRHPRDTLARASVVLAYADDRSAAHEWARRILGAKSAAPRDLAHALEQLREVAA